MTLQNALHISIKAIFKTCFLQSPCNHTYNLKDPANLSVTDTKAKPHAFVHTVYVEWLAQIFRVQEWLCIVHFMVPAGSAEHCEKLSQLFPAF